MNYHGYHRSTQDIDVWIAVEEANAKSVSKAMRYFGFRPARVSPSKFLKKGLVFVIGREPVRVDILTSVSGVDFDECYPRRIEATWDGVRVPIISREDLIANKKASGRPKDLADLTGLPSTDRLSSRRRRPNKKDSKNR